MRVADLIQQFDLNLYSGEKGLEREVNGGYACDLLSDVMGHAQEGQVWITLQTHKNVMAIASLKDLAAVILVKDHAPDEDAAAQSDQEGVPILGTSRPAFEMVGELYQYFREHEVL